MRFKDYIESLDIDLDKVGPIEKRYYEFEFDGESYEIYFDAYNLQIDRSIQGVQITFKGPNGCMPTGKSEYRALKLYAKMISAVIAYIEKYQPQCLEFSGATDTMEFIYKKFADRYAKDEPGKPSNRVFIRMNEREWIRKDVYENASEESKRRIANEIEAWKPYEKHFFDSRRARMMRHRENRRKYQGYVGGFMYSNGRWYLIAYLSQSGNSIFWAYDSDLYGRLAYDDDLQDATLVPPSQLNLVPRNVLEQFASKVNTPNFQSLMFNPPPPLRNTLNTIVGMQ